MNDLVHKYGGKQLSTDEVATARTEIEAAIKKLETIPYTTGEDYLLLKWGTLKEWALHSDKGIELVQQYVSLGLSLSGMIQHDTPEQKQLILQMIDECDGVIQNDWDGEYYTKDRAKAYIMEYGSA